MKYIKLYENFNDFDMTSAIQGFYQGIVTNLKDLLDALKVTNNLDKLDAILDELKNQKYDTLISVLGKGGCNISEDEFKRTEYFRNL